MRTCI